MQIRKIDICPPKLFSFPLPAQRKLSPAKAARDSLSNIKLYELNNVQELEYVQSYTLRKMPLRRFDRYLLAQMSHLRQISNEPFPVKSFLSDEQPQTPSFTRPHIHSSMSARPQIHSSLSARTHIHSSLSTRTHIHIPAPMKSMHERKKVRPTGRIHAKKSGPVRASRPLSVPMMGLTIGEMCIAKRPYIKRNNQPTVAYDKKAPPRQYVSIDKDAILPWE